MARPGGREVVRVGLLGRSGAGRVRICCKDVPRRDRRRAEARNINDYPPASWWDSGLCNRFGQPTPPRAPGGAPRVGRRPRRAPPGAETRASHSKAQFQPSFSSAKCTSRRGGGRSWSSRTAATAPPAPPHAHQRHHDHPHPRAAAPGGKGSLFGRWRLLVGRGDVRRNYSYPDRLRYRFLYHSTSPGSLLPGRSWFVRRARVHSTTIFS